MISQKTKKLIFRSLTVLAALIVTIIILECAASVLLSMNYSFEGHHPEPLSKDSADTKYTMEIFSAPPEKIYPDTVVPTRNPYAQHPSNHLDHQESRLNIPLNNFDGRIEKTLYTQKEPLYSIHLKLDNRGRRDTNAPSQNYKHHLALIGCSFAFGDAVNSESTLTAHWQKRLPSYKTYNLSFSGYGPRDIIARTQSFGFMEDISPKSGIGIYIYIEDHLKRSQGAMSVVGNWALRNAVLKETGPYSFEHVGSHLSARRIRTIILNTLWRSNIVHLFKMDWPPHFSDSDYDLMARELKAIEILYKQNTSQENPFVVAFYPVRMGNTDLPKLKRALEKHKVLFVDYTKYMMDNRIPVAAIVPHDGHPNSAAYEHLTDLLIRDLKDYLK